MKRYYIELANLFFAIRPGVILFLGCMAGVAHAQTPPPPLISPEVHSDRSVTFRFRAPNDKEVAVFVEGAANPLPMQKAYHRVSTVTTEPLAPDYSAYPRVPSALLPFPPPNHA